MFNAITRGVRVLAGGMVAVTLTLTAPAYAEADAVYGGSTTAHEPIVLRADRAGQRLRSAVMTWEAKCDQGAIFPFAAELPAVMLTRGLSQDAFELAMSRNAKGHFSGTQLAGFQLGSETAMVTVTFAGTLRARSAFGMLSADVAILDESGNEVDACHTGATRWNASRSPGRLFAGKTSQDEPIVLRLDAKRRNVRNVLVGWQTASCRPEAFGRFAESFTNFPLRGGRFGDALESSYDDADGGKLRYTMELAGKVTRRSAHGTLQATITGTDAAGATTLSCDSGGVTWKTATG
jgi:hypothetical protein